MSDDLRARLDELDKAASPRPWRGCENEDGEPCDCRQVWSTSADIMVIVAMMAHDENYTGGAGPTAYVEAKANAQLGAAGRLVPMLGRALLAAQKTMERSYWGGDPKESGLDSSGFGPDGSIAQARQALAELAKALERS